MLVLTRKIGERIVIGGDIVLEVLQVKGNRIRLGITAPPDVPVVREEIYQRQAHTRRPRRVRVRAATRPGHSLRQRVHQLRLGLTLLASQPPSTPTAQAMLEAMNQELALLREFYQRALTVFKAPALANVSTRGYDRGINNVSTNELDALTAVGRVLFNLDTALTR